ncbi:hypothetical protein ACFQ1E_06480 [Sphingomonas canadensis]|uniref:Preprotein translocase subunit YajC n=1 Tax=Sphingomonas canadensis TaxID=1219257 RepID=A0ABW3H3T2_9SPHN|nr:hypothetical protein [Sphingomonas canadensis]MCW3835564.1 hypothetical protein [Sphingomonas canadensis]
MTRLFVTTSAAALVLGCGIAAPAQAQERRNDITPYIEVGQVATADLNGGDVLTYTTVAAGIDASIQTRRVEVQVSYKYEHRFDYQKNVADQDIHSGIARVRGRVTPDLSIEAGGMAARARSDSRGPVPATGAGNVSNTSQVYSAYIGPNLATNVGPVFVNGAYRFGYTKAEAPDIPSTVPGQPPLDVYDDSKVHVATLSTGVKSGTVLPVGITASASWTREDAGQLDQKYDGKYARGDVVLPVGRGFALAGGVGYEKIEITQRDPLLDGTGAPVRDAAGRMVTDPASAPRIAYDFDGIFWDAGVIWRPSRRTFLEARVGQRYDSMSYTGSFSYQIGPQSGIQIGVYDSVESFGRQINGGLAALPTDFVTTVDPFGNQYSGCIFGTTGGAAGSCMNGILASTATANYRARGATGVVVLARGPIRMGLGGGYQRRNYIAPATGFGTGVNVNGSFDESYYIQAFASRELGRNAAISGSVFGNYSNSDLPGARGLYGWGANAMYSHRFGKLSGTAAVGVYGSEDETGNSITAAQALLGLRYGF